MAANSNEYYQQLYLELGFEISISIFDLLSTERRIEASDSWDEVIHKHEA